ncbi:MAG: hypothetical protein A3G34_08705 [Candidatus Lindowbacteria bacterium RIFCSPLOWO2_12_FULL_62_27]|nr:MAG: hypothetical protein A3G34_08705 [Candidatus Lindowbacteria bacterium RIFCSPLOWO2_12_FULL_62_27]
MADEFDGGVPLEALQKTMKSIAVVGEIGILTVDADNDMHVYYLVYDPGGESCTRWENECLTVFPDIRTHFRRVSWPRRDSHFVNISQKNFYLRDFHTKNTQVASCKSRSIALGVALCALSVDFDIQMNKVACTGDLNIDGDIGPAPDVANKLRDFGYSRSFEMILMPAQHKNHVERMDFSNEIAAKIYFVSNLQEGLVAVHQKVKPKHYLGIAKP